MRSALSLTLTAGLLLGASACSDDDADTNQNNQTQQDAAVQPDSAVQADSSTQEDGGTPTDQTIGSACECQDTGCEQFGVPVPNGGTIVGCDDVPANITGTELVCFRTYEGSLANDTYFANGYCALTSTLCTGADLICNSAVMGDYNAMTSCPTGTVMITDSHDVTVMANTAVIDNKTCVASCSDSSDCRTTEVDPELNDEPTQYDCIDKDGVKFCYDPRNLSANYTATQF